MIGNLPRETGLKLEKCIRRAIENANSQVNNKNSSDTIGCLKASLMKQLNIFSETFLESLSSDGVLVPMLISTDPNVRLEDRGSRAPDGWTFNPTYGTSTFKLPRPLVYSVRTGDTLYTICTNKGFGDIIVSELCSWNKIKETDTLKPGQKIWLFDSENLIVKDIRRVYGENVTKDTVIDPSKLDHDNVKLTFKGDSYNFLASIAAPCHDIVALAEVDISVIFWYCYALNVCFLECNMNDAQMLLVEFYKPARSLMNTPAFGISISNNPFQPFSPSSNINNPSGISGSNWDKTMKYTSIGNNTAGFLASAGEYSNVRNGMWKGVNGVWNDLSYAGDVSTGTQSAAICKAGVYRFVSKITFGVGTGISAIQGFSAYLKGDSGGVAKSILDIAAGYIATFCGPPGWILGGFYFLFDAFGVYEPMNSPNQYKPPLYNLPDNTNYVPPKFKPLL